MKTVTDDEVLEYGKVYFIPLSLFYIISIFIIIISIFTFIWGNSSTAFKLLMTGFSGFVIFLSLYHLIKYSCRTILEKK